MTQNTNPEKPGWFELIDGDAPSAQVQKVGKALPAVAAVVAGAIIATGAFFANASSEPATQVVAADSQSSGASQGAPAATQASTPGVTAPGASTTSASTPGVTNPAAPGMLPPGGDDDDDDDHEWGDDDHDDDDHDDRPSRRGHHDDDEEDDD